MSRGSVTFRRTRDGGKEHCGPAFTRAGAVVQFSILRLKGFFAASRFFSRFFLSREHSLGAFRWGTLTVTGVCVGMGCGG